MLIQLKTQFNALYIFLMKVSVIIGILIVLSSCGLGATGDYNFITVATYKAENSEIQVNLTASGYVPYGADLGDGQAKGTIISSHLRDTVYFKANKGKLTEFKYNQKIIELVKPDALAHCFDNIGYVTYDKKELKELEQLINVATYGPKGTYLDGQTAVIKVVNVDFEIN